MNVGENRVKIRFEDLSVYGIICTTWYQSGKWAK